MIIAIYHGLNFVFVSKYSDKASPYGYTFYFFLPLTFISYIISFFDPHFPTFNELFLVLCSGALVMLSIVCWTSAFHIAGRYSSIISCFLFTQIIWAAIYGNILFSEKYNLVLVALPNENIVVAVDLNNFELIKKIDVGDHPHSMNISPDGLYLYVANTASDNVSVIDLKKLIVVSTISVGKAPTDIVFYLPNSNSTDNINNNEVIEDDSETEFDASRYTCGAYIHVRD